MSDTFTADQLARHPEWRLLTNAKRHQLTHRRLFRLRVPKGASAVLRKSAPLVAITDDGILYYEAYRHQLRTQLPTSYGAFMRTLQNHNLLVHALSQPLRARPGEPEPPAGSTGWHTLGTDGLALYVRMRP